MVSGSGDLGMGRREGTVRMYSSVGGVFLHRNKLESNVHLHRQVDDGALV